jgi:hypothetical protein
LKKLDKNLFKIETNINFKKIKIRNKKEYSEIKYIFNSFLPKKKINNVYLLNKSSPTSKIFLIYENKKIKILRRSERRYHKNTIKILNIVSNIKKGFFFEPIKNIDGSYVLARKKYIYILYNRIQGSVFNGDVKRYYDILKKSILLHRELKFFKLKKEKIITFNNFKDVEDFLVNIKKNFCKFLNPSASKILKLNSNFLLKKIMQIKKIKFHKDNQVVHGDINHSNVIINKDNIYFLDLEDIRCDSLKVAISYLVFKLLRHSIYKKKINVSKIQNKILPITHQILKNKNIIINNNDMFNYVFYKILLDIAFIFNNLKKKNYAFLYDLEKKLLNLVELRYMFLDDELEFKK